MVFAVFLAFHVKENVLHNEKCDSFSLLMSCVIFRNFSSVFFDFFGTRVKF